MPITSQAFAISPLVGPALGTLRVVASDDQPLAEFMNLFLGPAFTGLNPKVGSLRLQDADDVGLDTNYLQITTTPAAVFVDLTLPGVVYAKLENDLMIVPSAAAAAALTIRNTADTGNVGLWQENGVIIDNATITTGVIANLAYAIPTVLTGLLVGLNINLDTNVTQGANSLAGLNITLPNPYGAGASYTIFSGGGGYSFNACDSVNACAGYFSDAVRSVKIADGTNAITVVAGNTDVSVGSLLVHFYSQAGDPALADGELAIWLDTGGPTYYIGMNIPGATGIKKVAII